MFAAVDAPPCPLPHFTCRVSAGFPSPAEDYMEGALDLNAHLVARPAATFILRVTGDSMVGAGIMAGDLLVVDKSLAVAHGKIIIASIGGELSVKKLEHRKDGTYLCPANERYPAKRIDQDTTFEVWGVVVWVIHRT